MFSVKVVSVIAIAFVLSLSCSAQGPPNGGGGGGAGGGAGGAPPSTTTTYNPEHNYDQHNYNRNNNSQSLNLVQLDQFTSLQLDPIDWIRRQPVR